MLWSPAGTICSVAHSKRTRQPDSSGTPCASSTTSSPAKALLPGLVELPAQLLLVLTQHVDGEVVHVSGELVVAARAAGDAPQKKRRLQRQRGQAVDGHAKALTGAAAGGDNGYAGGEVAEGLT